MEKSLSDLLYDLEEAMINESEEIFDIKKISSLADDWEDDEWQEL